MNRQMGERSMGNKVRVLVVGVGNMGLSHAKAYKSIEGFELVGLMSRTITSRKDLPPSVERRPAVRELRPGAGDRQAGRRLHQHAIPDTHASYALKAFDAGCHVFSWKSRSPTNVADAEKIVRQGPGETNRKLVIGYILRVHPSWTKFIEVARTLGKPLVMRMNLNQQSVGTTWTLAQEPDELAVADRRLRRPLCRRDVPDDRRRSRCASTASARDLSDEVKVYNYGHLQVTFDDGSVGWYEAGWGPMMSEVAFFVKDVAGPKGCVSIVVPHDETTPLGAMTIRPTSTATPRPTRLKVHYADIGRATTTSPASDEWINLDGRARSPGALQPRAAPSS